MTSVLSLPLLPMPTESYLHHYQPMTRPIEFQVREVLINVDEFPAFLISTDFDTHHLMSELQHSVNSDRRLNEQMQSQSTAKISRRNQAEELG